MSFNSSRIHTLLFLTLTLPIYICCVPVSEANGSVKELVFPKALDLDRPKRARTTFSPDQLNELEEEFQKNQYLVGRERTDLSKRLKLSETQVYLITFKCFIITWFHKRGTKKKRYCALLLILKAFL